MCGEILVPPPEAAREMSNMFDILSWPREANFSPKFRRTLPRTAFCTALSSRTRQALNHTNSNGKSAGSRARFSKVPKLFRWHNHSFCIFKTKASRDTTLCSHFYFLFSLQLMKRQALQNKQVGSFTNSFSGPKSFWDFRETGLWFEKIPLVTNAFQCPATKTTREAEWYFYFCMLTGSLSNLRNINSNYKQHFFELFRTGNLIPKKRFFLSLFGLLHFVPFPGILTRFIKYLDLIFCREHLYQKDIIYTRL